VSEAAIVAGCAETHYEFGNKASDLRVDVGYRGRNYDDAVAYTSISGEEVGLHKSYGDG
jgi:hypothetical protein